MTPLACRLTTPELAERRAGLLARLRAQVAARDRTPGGYRLKFTPEGSVLELIAQVVDAERTCCPFLRFDLTVEPEGGPVWLQITGPEGTHGFLEETFGL